MPSFLRFNKPAAKSGVRARFGLQPCTAFSWKVYCGSTGWPCRCHMRRELPTKDYLRSLIRLRGYDYNLPQKVKSTPSPLSLPAYRVKHVHEKMTPGSISREFFALQSLFLATPPPQKKTTKKQTPKQTTTTTTTTKQKQTNNNNNNKNHHHHQQQQTNKTNKQTRGHFLVQKFSAGVKRTGECFLRVTPG